MSRTTATLERRIEQMRSKALDTADHGTDRVADAAGRMSDTLRHAAGRVDQPQVARALKSSSKTVRSTEKLFSDGAAGVATRLTESARAHPGRVAFIAIALGLLLGWSSRRRSSDPVGTGSILVVEVKEIR
ncbi:MAG: hypothetical protein ACFCVC_15465 [Acidimicrobiia bacterium]